MRRVGLGRPNRGRELPKKNDISEDCSQDPPDPDKCKNTKEESVAIQPKLLPPGLDNNGYDCFAIVIMQMFGSVDQLEEKLMSARPLQLPNDYMVERLTRFLRELSRRSNPSIRKFLFSFSEVYSEYGKEYARDCIEFLDRLMLEIEESLFYNTSMLSDRRHEWDSLLKSASTEMVQCCACNNNLTVMFENDYRTYLAIAVSKIRFTIHAVGFLSVTAAHKIIMAEETVGGFLNQIRLELEAFHGINVPAENLCVAKVVGVGKSEILQDGENLDPKYEYSVCYTPTNLVSRRGCWLIVVFATSSETTRPIISAIPDAAQKHDVQTKLTEAYDLQNAIFEWKSSAQTDSENHDGILEGDTVVITCKDIPSWLLNVRSTEDSTVNIQDCIDYHTQSFFMGAAECNKCGVTGVRRTGVSWFQLGEYATFCLRRFKRTKNGKYVFDSRLIPIQYNVDLEVNGITMKYELVTCIVYVPRRKDQVEHYYAFSKREDIWYEFNDNHVEAKDPPPEIINKFGHTFMYRRLGQP